MSADSTPRSRRSKAASSRPEKPYPDFPLYAHPLGYWTKKIRGKLHHFGRWAKVVDGKLTPTPYEEGWQKALTVYKAKVDDLHSGRLSRGGVVVPTPAQEGLTVKALCDRFYSSKLRAVEAGELSPRSLQEYDQTCARMVKSFGRDRLVVDLVADDFEHYRAKITKPWGPVRVGNEVGRVRTVFKYGYESGLIDRPMRFGPTFVKPSRSVMRKHRAKGGKRLLGVEELWTILDALAGKEVSLDGIDPETGEPKKVKRKADPVIRAAVLLGLNCGYGNTDVADLSTSALDLDGGWIDFPRPKTGIERRCPLWPETVAALRRAIEVRPTPRQKEDADCVFLTARRERLVRPTGKARTDAVAVRFGALLRSLGINGRKGLGFYTLRHVFRTVADGALDRVAIDLMMGHADPSMGAVYREHIDDARLVAVSDLVRAWLFGEAEKAEGGEA
ncbi:MAG: tyrosine-type recombinase/integrase [Planctomycetales bacterium]